MNEDDVDESVIINNRGIIEAENKEGKLCDCGKMREVIEEIRRGRKVYLSENNGENKCKLVLENKLKKMLLNLNKEVDKIKDKNNNTFLHLLIKDNDIESFKLFCETYWMILWDKKKEFYDWFLTKNTKNHSIIDISIIKNISHFHSFSKVIFSYIQRTESSLLTFQDYKESTIFHKCSKNGNFSALYFWVEKLQFFHKFKIFDVRDEKGKTPLLCAVENKSEKCAEFLVGLGADLDALDDEGESALICAVKNGDVKMVKKLLLLGANKNVKDSKNKTAATYALELGHKKLCLLLSDSQCSCKNSFCCGKSSQKSIGKEQLGEILLEKKSEKYEKTDNTTVKRNVKIIKKYGKEQFFIYFLVVYGYFIVFLNARLFSVSEFEALFEENVWFKAIVCELFVLVVVYVMLMLFSSYFLYCSSKNTHKKAKFFPIKSYKINSFCIKCNTKIKSKTVHCLICDVCVDDWYQHCFWLNACVSMKNVKVFNSLNITLFIFNAINLSLGALFISFCVFDVDNFTAIKEIILGDYFETEDETATKIFFVAVFCFYSLFFIVAFISHLYNLYAFCNKKCW